MLQTKEIRQKLIEAYSTDIILLGENILQKYILRLGNRYNYIKDIQKHRIDKDLINNGVNVLLYLLKYKIVKIQRIENNLVYLNHTLDIEIEIDKIEKDILDIYPIFENKPMYSNKRILSIKEDIITNYTNIARVNRLNKAILNRLSSTPFEITSEFSYCPRVPKKGESSIDKNYMIETHIKRTTQQKFNGKLIYFPYQYDKRGRIYCKSYLLNTQSEEWGKACINLGYKQKVDFLGKIALEKELASLYGLQSHTADDKIKWTKENIELIINTAKYNTLHNEADKPILFLKACKAYKNVLDNKSINYMCNIDATSSGIQILSILSKCQKSAKYTNLTNDTNRYDLYSEFSKEFLLKIDKSNEEITQETLKKSRKILKPCLMTHFYNSIEGIKKKLYYNERYYNTFINVAKEMCVGPTKLLDYLNEVYKLASKKPYISWVMPDGFEVVIEQTKDVFHKVKTPLFSCIFKYQTIGIDEQQNKRKLPASIVHSIDSFVCRELIRRCDFIVSPIHDSFYTHPNNINKVLNVYNEILQEINNGKYKNLLRDIVSDILGYKVKTPFDDLQPLEDIRESYYSVC